MQVLCLLIFFIVGCSSNRYTMPDIPIYEEIPAVPLPPRKAPPLIIVDPGHGGEDQGTLSILKPAYQEKFLTLATAKMLQDNLQKLGYLVKMTRTDDTFVSLSNRCKIANDANAACFVSIHYNSAPSQEAHGIEIFYFPSETDNKRMNRSKDLAKQVLDKIIPLSKAKSRGVKSGNFAVIRETKMPAILVEGGFLTNKDELNKIKNPEYLKLLAWGIAQGVDAYIHKQLE